MAQRKGYRLFDALRRAGTAFAGGAPDPEQMQRDRGISPQMQSNIEQGRVRQFRRMRTAPRPRKMNMGVPDPFYRPRAPMGAPEAASEMAAKFGKVGVQYAPELNRFTAPDPMTYAKNARAPEFIGNELALDAADVRAMEAEAATTEIANRFKPDQLTLGLEKDRFGLERDQAVEEQLQKTRPLDIDSLERARTLGDIEVTTAQRTEAGAPRPEEMIADRATDREYEARRERIEVNQIERKQKLQSLQADIESLEAQGMYDEANQVRQQKNAILDGRMGPPAPTEGGAPPMSTGNINPVMLERRGAEASAIAQATGLEGAMGFLDDIAADRGAPNAGTAEKMESALATIKLEGCLVRETPLFYALCGER